MKIKNLSTFLMATLFVGSTVIAQEYDDMYFSKKDRKEMQELTARVMKPSTDFGVQNQPASKYANPDFNGAVAGNTYTPTYNYYDESVANAGSQNNGNFNDPMGWNPYGMNSPFYDPFMNGMYDPFMNPHGGMGMWNPYFGTMGMRPGWNMNMGFNSMFGPNMGFGYNRMMGSGLSMGLYSGFNAFGFPNRFGRFGGSSPFVPARVIRPVEVVRRPVRTRMTTTPARRMSIAEATRVPDSERVYPSRIRNYNRRNTNGGTPASNGRYSRSSYSNNRNSSGWASPTRRSTGSSWGNNNSRSSSPSYRSTSSSPSYSRPASSGMSSPSRATRSIRRN